MLKSLIAAIGVALLLGACSSSPPPQAAAPPPAAPAKAPSYLVFFDWDRSDLSNQAIATIKQAAAAFKTSGSARITAIGHTDSSGPPAYNQALSVRRANTVKRALMREGVPDRSIDTQGRGETQLLVQTGDGVREPQNRRVEIVGLQQQGQVPAIFADAMSYCKALSDKYRQYRLPQTNSPEAIAMYQCEQGNTAAGIPVLEEALTDAKIPLPAPGYRWPGRSID